MVPGSEISLPAMQSARFVESYFDAWNQHDPMGVANHLTPDGFYCDVRQNARNSREELVDYLQLFFRRYRHRYELIGDILSNGNTVAFEYQMISSETPRRKSEPVCRGAEFITLEADSAKLIADYCDFPEEPAAASVEALPSPPQRKYAKSGLTDSRMRAYMKALDSVMREGEAYLDTELTLPLLAERINCSVNHLSQVINAGFGMSFFDYVNRYRVKRAMGVLHGLDDCAAVLKVAYSVGFNSNSAFYTAFKKHAGMTPAQFRRTHARHE
jgi:AraC-like DNA-binding protein